MSTSNNSRTIALRAGAVGAAAGVVAALGVMSMTAEAQQAPRLLAPPVAADGTLSFADLVERVRPAVVSVLVERQVERPQLPSQLEEFFRFRFGAPDDFFGSPFGDGGTERMQAQGSGFFIDSEGHIVTNNHVIENADRIQVRLNDGTVLSAELVGADPLTDLAVLKVDPPKNQPFVKFAEDVNLRVGDWVVAVGNPFGLSGTVTAGIVSAIGGEGRDATYVDFIQIDAPINRGNSGGPTFDLKGRVVGVNTAIYSTNGGNMGIGFAIPARVAKETVEQLIRNGSVVRGWLGVSIQPVTTEIAAALGRKEAKGALVAEVIPDTPAERAGFRSGDLVLELEGKQISDPRDLTRSVAALPPGQKVKVKVLRDGAERTLTVTLGSRDESPAAATQPQQRDGQDSLSADLGLRVSELNGPLRQQFRIPEDVRGVIVTGVRRGSPAEAAGLRTGMVILEVDGKPATSPSALNKVVEEAKKAGKEAVLMRFQAGEAKQFGALPLKSAE